MWLERWQTPSVFVIGLLKRFRIWQPFVVEPLCIYTSDGEKEEFHNELIDKSIVSLRDRNEFGFEWLSEEYGLEEAEEYEETIEREIRRLLSGNCWETPTEVSELVDLFSVIIELLQEKDESDAVMKIVTYTYMSSSELAQKMFEESKLFLSQIDQKYHSLLLEVLNGLNPKLDLKKLISEGLAFYDLILSILEKGRLKILWARKQDSRFPIYRIRVSLVLNGKERRFTLENIDSDEIGVLEALCGK